MTISGRAFKSIGLYTAGVCSSEVSQSKAAIFNLLQKLQFHEMRQNK